MSSRKRKSTAVKKNTSQPGDSTVEKTLGSTSTQNVESGAETTKPPKQVKFDESTKFKETDEPETQASVSGKPKLDKPLTESKKQKKSKTAQSSTSTSTSKENMELAEISDFGSSSNDEDDQSDSASGENVKPDISNLNLGKDLDSEKKTSTAEVEGEEAVEQKPENLPKKTRRPSIFDVDDISTTSSPSSDDKSDDTTSSSPTF